MKERPILMTPENAQRCFDGTKWQTRRIVKPQPELLYGITDDRIEPLYLSKEALDELNSITIRNYTSSDSDLAKLGLHGGKRWACVLADALQGIRAKGIRGLVSVSRSQKRQGVLECVVVPRKQEGHAVGSSADLHGISRYAAIPNGSSTAPGRQSVKLRSRQCDLGDADRELDRSKGARTRDRGREASCGKADRRREASSAVGLEGRALQSAPCSENAWDEPVCHIVNSRYQVGTRLWIREAFCLCGEEGSKTPLYRGQCEEYKSLKPIWTPSIHMHRFACRTVLEITEIRVERLQEISEDDAKAEGVTRIDQGREYYFSAMRSEPDHRNWVDPTDAYKELWESINGFNSWAQNPWVWVITFKKVGDS